MKAPFQIYFLNQEGPLVQAGDTDPATSAFVRVDDGKPHALTPFMVVEL